MRQPQPLAPRTEAADATVQVVHAIPGRLRLRVPALKDQPVLAEQVRASGMAHRGVRSIRVNPQCASVIVEGSPAACAQLANNGLVHQWLEAPSPAAQVDGPVVAQVAAPSQLGPFVLTAAGLALTLLGGGLPRLLAAGAIGLGALPVIRRAAVALVRERRPTGYQLDVVGTGLMLLAGDVRSAAVTRLLAMLATEIRDRTARRSRRVTVDLGARMGRWAWLVEGEQETRVPIRQVQVDDLVVVRPGERVPVDGVVVEGSGRVTQRALMGESRPIAKGPGDLVFATTRVIDGGLRVQAQAVGENTRAGWIVRTVQQAPEHDTRAADYAEQVADRLVIPTVALALLSLAATRDAGRAAAILNVDFTTGIDLSAPTSFLTTMARAARQGVLIKSGRAIECLATADAVVFDKTGTVTHGRPEVAEVVSLGDQCSPSELLALAAAAELNLRHLIGQAIVRHARRLHVALSAPESVEVSPRLGVLAEVGGRRVRVGSYRFLAEAGFRMEQADAHTSRLRHKGYSAAWVAVDDALTGFIAYHDPPRAESAAVVAWLRAHGVPDIHLATGDGPLGAQAVARALDITEVHAAALPEDKAAVVQQLQQAGHVVVVVGDGVDDAPALALANVSVSLAHGADIARETADVVLLEPQLTGLVRAIELSREALGLVRENLFLVGVPNAAALLLGLAGHLSPVAARLLSDSSTLLAAANSLRPLLTRDRGGPLGDAPRGALP